MAGEQGRVVVYTRVSSHDQRADLGRQVARVTGWATGNGYRVSEVAATVGKALLFTRPGPAGGATGHFRAYDGEHEHSAGSCPGTPARDQLPGVRAPSRPVGAGGHAQTHRFRRAAAPTRLAVQRPEPAPAVPRQLRTGFAR